MGLRDIHPPSDKDVAKSYENVVGAEQTRLARILEAEAAAIRTNNLAIPRRSPSPIGRCQPLRTISSAYARAALFTNQIPAYAAAPAVYSQRQYLQGFATAT